MRGRVGADNSGPEVPQEWSEMIELLGPVMIANGSSRETVRAAKVRTLLAVLAVEVGRVVPYGQLAEELWGENPPRTARNALQANVVRLRRLLNADPAADAGAHGVEAVGGGYLLNVPPKTIDAMQFLDLFGRGAVLADANPERASGLLREALLLWRGDALADVEEGARCRLAAAHLTEARMSAYEHLFAAQLRIGAERSAIADLTRLVIQFPEREIFSEQLMVALYRCGRQSEALAVFQRTRQWLDSELALEPGLPMRDLYQKILTQDEMLAGRVVSSVP
jgi:DNA-binding SARP family transcriptional activator